MSHRNKGEFMIKLNTAKLIKLSPTQGIKMNDNILTDMINKMRISAVSVSDERFYKPISQSIVNNNRDYKAIALSISQDEDKYCGHMLEISVLDNFMREHKRPLAYGDKNTIISYLTDKDAVKNIRQDLIAIIDEIKQN